MAASIAIVIVMFLINAFMIYAVIRTWEKVNEKLEKYFLVRTSNFAKLGEKRLEENKLNNNKPAEKEVIVKQTNIYIADAITDKTKYKDDKFKDDYKAVKETMDFSKRNIVKEIVNENEKESNSQIALRLSKEFSFDLIYELSTLSSQDQLTALKDSLNNQQKSILNTYLENNNKPFNAIEFFDYVKRLAQSEDPNYYVKTGWESDDFSNLDDKIVTQHDATITEGIKVIHKDKLYDYSI